MINHKHLVLIGIIIAVVFLPIAISTRNLDVLQLASRLFNGCVVLAAGELYTMYYRTKHFNTDETIASNPVAIANHLGSRSIAFGLGFFAPI